MAWIYVCAGCGEEIKIEAEEYPDDCPHCGGAGEFDLIDGDED